MKTRKLDEEAIIKKLEYGMSMWSKELVEKEQGGTIRKIIEITNGDFSKENISDSFLKRIAKALRSDESNKNTNSLLIKNELKKRGLEINSEEKN